jgi:hypothetical protein
MNPVDVSDLALRWRPLTADESVVAAALIDDAFEMLIARVPGLESRLTSGDLRPGLVVKVVTEMVKPVMMNPEGMLEESIDNWSGRRDSAMSTGQMQVSDDQIRLLMGGVIRKSFSIVPGGSGVC